MTSRAVDRDVAVDAGRIKYVTEHFQQLQGLGTAACEASWSMLELAMDLKLPAFWKIFAVLMMGGVIWAYRTDYFPRYYRRRFGAIEQKPVPREWGIVTQFVAFATLLVGLMLLGSVLRFEQYRLLLFLLALVLTLGAAWRRSEHSLDLRDMYFLPAMLAVVWIYGYPMWHTPDNGHAAMWKTLCDLAMPVFLVVTGLCDHLLLLRLMPKRISEDDYDG